MKKVQVNYYLLSLQEHHSLRYKEGQSPSVKIVDIVLLYNEGTKQSLLEVGCCQ